MDIHRYGLRQEEWVSRRSRRTFLINELQAHFDINLPISIYWLLDSSGHDDRAHKGASASFIHPGLVEWEDPAATWRRDS